MCGEVIIRDMVRLVCTIYCMQIEKKKLIVIVTSMGRYYLSMQWSQINHISSIRRRKQVLVNKDINYCFAELIIWSRSDTSMPIYT